MNTADLKIFTMHYISEHDELLGEEKISILEFVKDADIEQVIYLLATGIVDPLITEKEIFSTKEVVSFLEINPLALKQTFGAQAKGVAQAASGKTYDVGVARGAVGGLAVAAAVAMAALAAAKVYKRFLSKAAKACKDKAGPAKTSCMQKFKLQAQKAKVAELQKGVSKCSKSKKPDACKSKLMKKIAQEKAKLGQ